MPSRQSSGTSRTRSARWTITSAPSTWPASAARQPRPSPALRSRPTTMDRDCQPTSSMSSSSSTTPALLVVLGLGVHGPDVVVRPVDEVERGEDRRPHRVVLVVVAVEPVAAERLQVREPGQVAAQERRPPRGSRGRTSGTPSARAPLRRRRRRRVDQADPRHLVRGERDRLLVGHLPDRRRPRSRSTRRRGRSSRAGPCRGSRRRSSARGRRPCPGRGGRSSCPGRARSSSIISATRQSRGSAGACAACDDLVGRRRVEARDQLAERHARDDAVDGASVACPSARR